MACVRCGKDIADDAAFCQYCGVAQHVTSETPGHRVLRRSVADRQVAGICGGIARYLDVDPVFIRLAWVVLTLVPGAIFFGVLAYLIAWLIIPEAEPGQELEPRAAAGTWRAKRLQRSGTDVKVAGICGGIAEYFSVDPTAVRLLWVVLSIFPGAIICGVLVYVVAWFVMPAAPLAAPPQTTPTTTPAPAGGAPAE